MGDGTNSTPGFWGVATLETNFTELEQYGHLPVRQGHLPDQHHRRDQDRDDHAQGHRRRRHRRHPRLRPRGRQLRPRARRPGRGSARRAATTDLLRMQGGFYIGIKTAGGFELTVFATAELSFGVGAAQLTFGSATALLIVNAAAASPAASRSAPAAASGCPTAARVQGHRVGAGHVQHDAPGRHLRAARLLPPAAGQRRPRRRSRSSARAPGFDGQRNPNAPAGGEIYVKAIVDAHLVDRRCRHDRRLHLDHRRRRPPTAASRGLPEDRRRRRGRDPAARRPRRHAEPRGLRRAPCPETGVVGRIQITRGSSSRSRGSPSVASSCSRSTPSATPAADPTFAVKQRTVTDRNGVAVTDLRRLRARRRRQPDGDRPRPSQSGIKVVLAGYLDIGDRLASTATSCSRSSPPAPARRTLDAHRLRLDGSRADRQRHRRRRLHASMSSRPGRLRRGRASASPCPG